MRHAARRFGPVLLWQLGTLLLWLGAIAIAVPLRRSFEGPMIAFFETLLALLLLIVSPTFLQIVSLALLTRARKGRQPAIAADFSRLTGSFLQAVPTAAGPVLNSSMRDGFLTAASIFTFLFLAFVASTWVAWRWGYLRPKPEDEDEDPTGVPRGIEAGGLRFIAETNDDGFEELGFRVVADGPVAAKTVLAAFTDAQLLPKLAGGKRAWSMSIDERLVATVMQTWEHPRWWPPIEWSTDPDEPFPMGSDLRLRVVPGETA